MTYGLSPRLFVENGPAIRAASALNGSSSSAFRAWSSLDRESRLKLVEKALKPAANDDSVDSFPLAL